MLLKHTLCAAANVLAPTVASEDLDLGSKLSADVLDEVVQGVGQLRLQLQEVDPAMPLIVVDKGDEVEGPPN